MLTSMSIKKSSFTFLCTKKKEREREREREIQREGGREGRREREKLPQERMKSSH